MVGSSRSLTECSLCAVPAARVRRSGHEDRSRQQFQEDDTDPARHPVRARSTEVPVDDDDGDEDCHDVHDEREQQVLGNRTSDVITICVRTVTSSCNVPLLTSCVLGCLHRLHVTNSDGGADVIRKRVVYCKCVRTVTSS